MVNNTVYRSIMCLCTVNAIRLWLEKISLQKFLKCPGIITVSNVVGEIIP